MRWTPGNRSNNLEDARGSSGPSLGGGGGGGALFGLLAMFVGRRFGIVGVVVLMVLAAVFGRGFLGGGGAPAGANGAPGGRGTSAVAAGEVDPRRDPNFRTTAEEERLVDFMSFVLDDAQAKWDTILPRQLGTAYRPARLRLFREATATGCGNAPASVGPFYCPRDERVYIDLSFFEELQRRYGAPGDFAQAYVLAHELGHHVQKVTGTEARVRQLQGQRPDQQNALSVRLELQADCYAGVWAHTAARNSRLEVGDVDEALGAAAAVGDDRLQQRARGDVNPDSFTHGSAAQRQTWFKRGFESGDPRSCDTFAGSV